MSGHNAPSPAPRSASIGPNGPLQPPTPAPIVNGVGGGNAPQPAVTGGGGGGGGNQMTQQNLNQIVSASLETAFNLSEGRLRYQERHRKFW
jgi:hypothetical protein